MEPNESERASAAEERLRELEDRLNRASEAAERLMAEAARAAASGGGDPGGDAGTGGDAEAGGDAGPGGDPGGGSGGSGAGGEPGPGAGKPPPAGWQAADADDSTSSGRGDLELLMQVVESVRDLIPPDLQRRLAEALRELLLALRALIDWYLERSEGRRREAAEVQDIPIL